MDNSFLNYQNTLANFSQQRAQADSEAETKLDEAREKIKQFTAPFEGPMAEKLTDLFGKGVKSIGKSALKKAGLTEEKAAKLAEAYNKNGTKGVIQELGRQNPNLSKNLKKPLSQPEPDQDVKLAEPAENDLNIEDLLPEDFQKVKGSVRSAMTDELKKLPDDKASEFLDKFKPVNDVAEFGGDADLKAQHNLQKMRNVLDEVKGDSEDASKLTIGGMTPKEYSDPIIRDALKSSVKSEVDELHPAYRAKFNDLMKNRIASKEDIADDLTREKFNLHQASKTLDDIKTLEPEELKPLVPEITPSSAPSTSIQQVSSIGRQIAGDDEDFEAGVLGQTKKSITNVFKTATKAAGEVTEDVGKQAAEAAGKAAGKEVVESAAKKAATEGGEIIAGGGGPEDPLSDIVGLGAAIATTLGGIFSAAHMHKPAEEMMRNVGYQLGF